MIEDDLQPFGAQRAGNRRRVRLAVGIAQGSEGAGVALPVQDRPDDRQAGAAGDVAYDVSELQVHQLEGFLHVLNMLGSVGHEHRPAARRSPLQNAHDQGYPPLGRPALDLFGRVSLAIVVHLLP